MFIYIAILIIVGIILLVLEILILPGLIAGAIGGLFLLVALSWTFKVYGTTVGIYTSVATVLLTALSIYMALRSKMWSRFSLKTDLKHSRANVLEEGLIEEGSEAFTVSALRPMGMIMIADKKVEARTNGEHIPENSRVTIIKVLPNGVI